ncbi:AAA family ATPase [Butyrivibrio sp. TB]|uniref:AAA family ATPase n=1 Tax=Butyrivibrio sp. TB TaxID=1520809 RepID=UPI0008C8B008|nr:ATP-binding protein [Butyrivibrio sp. TB]SEQ64697.1 hypothetical protein SAMN02910382_03666 [Butyrivibrio sp. TB]
MLIQYSVKNYKSIKDEVIINFSSLVNETDEKVLVNEEKTRLYKTIGLIGPNASGKSNILDSLFFSIRFINLTIKRKESARINVEPFMLDSASRNDSTSFEYIFIEDGVKYVYGFSINSIQVMEEYLLAYYSQRPVTLFERKSTRNEEYDFKEIDISIQSDISKKTNSNRLYLSVAAEWGYERVKPVYKWFERMFRQYSDMNTSKVIEQVLNDDDLKNILMESLSKADFNISDLFIKNRRLEKQQRDALATFFGQLMGESEFVPESIPEDTPVICVTHKSACGEEYTLELTDDSSGTQDVINDIAQYLYLRDGGGLIIEDEMGRNYHTKLTEYYINLFNNDTRNKGKVQMIFSTHDSSVLNILSPEQVYLVDKDENGGTYVKLLDDYIIREKDNIELGYLKGRYGAIPNIKGELWG